jgi:peptide chain release factor 3
MERVIVGVVGVLQFDVLEFRMESEYGVKYYKRDTPHQLIRYIDNDPAELNPASLRLMQNTKWVQDVKGRNLLVFVGDYEIDWALDKNPGLKLSEFHQNM